jgi:hypothetical protein
MNAAANGANGPVTSTLLTLLAGLPIVAPPRRSEKEGWATTRYHLDYADVSRTLTPADQQVLTEIGITPGSA